MMEGILEKMMGNMDIQKMLPQQREIEEYKLISTVDISDLNIQAKELVSKGFEPVGFVSVSYVKETIQGYILYYTKEFIKYKKNEKV